MNLDLTPAQRAAVETEAHEALVIAGAGSGKTRVLAARVHRLLTHGVSPYNLLVLTFTRKAAAELKARLATIMESVGGHPLRGALIGTFHAIALKILAIDGGRLGYDTKSLTVMDPDDADLLLKQVCADHGHVTLGDTLKWRHDLSWKRITQYREYRYTQSKAPEWLDEKAALIADTVMGEYWSRCKHQNLLDFGLILKQTRKLLGDEPEVLERWRVRILHVLVDELQDSDKTQYDLHDFFAPPGSFFGVGDFRQSIYGFRGARPHLMKERHPEAQVYHLNECFRCGDRIVDAANTLIDKNQEPLTEPMTGVSGRIGSVGTVPGRSSDIIKTIVQAAGSSWRELAVIARKHQTLKRLAELCEQGGIPHHRVGAKFDITATDEFRRLHAALRLCVNPRDDLAFMRLAPAFRLTQAQYTALRRKAASDGTAHFIALYDCDPLAILVDIIASYGEAIEDSKLPTDIPSWVMQLEALLSPNDGVTPREAAAVDFWCDNCKEQSVADALEWFALRDSQDDLTDADAVTLITAHAAKGLEWDTVIMAECNEGDFPSGLALHEATGVKDERRLFYVALTRARETAIMHYRRACDQNPERKIKCQSRYVAETGILTQETVDAQGTGYV
jgi:DNA helicase-2/ATP-dependent DNA helicase PcrA